MNLHLVVAVTFLSGRCSGEAQTKPADFDLVLLATIYAGINQFGLSREHLAGDGLVARKLL
jgi:hypothetical protein